MEFLSKDYQSNHQIEVGITLPFMVAGQVVLSNLHWLPLGIGAPAPLPRRLGDQTHFPIRQP